MWQIIGRKGKIIYWKSGKMENHGVALAFCRLLNEKWTNKLEYSFAVERIKRKVVTKKSIKTRKYRRLNVKKIAAG